MLQDETLFHYRNAVRRAPLLKFVLTMRLDPFWDNRHVLKSFRCHLPETLIWQRILESGTLFPNFRLFFTISSPIFFAQPGGFPRSGDPGGGGGVPPGVISSPNASLIP